MTLHQATSQAPFAATASLKHKNNGVYLTRADLNKAIFINPQYQYGEGHTYKSNTVDISLNIRGNRVTLNANLNGAQGQQNIDLSFTQLDNNILHLQSASVTKNTVTEEIRSTDRLSEVLVCIYRHVRESADPKWAGALRESQSDRLSGGACISIMPSIELLHTGLLPTFDINDGGLKYNAPKIGKDKICSGNCGKCRLKF